MQFRSSNAKMGLIKKKDTLDRLIKTPANLDSGESGEIIIWNRANFDVHLLKSPRLASNQYERERELPEIRKVCKTHDTRRLQVA